MSSPTSVDAARIRAAYGRIRAEVGEGTTVVAATKYFSLEQMDALAGAGVEVVGENRAQDLGQKHERYGDRFRWHFIGHLQSRKAKDVSALCELCHSLASLSAARRLAIPALVEVNLSGEESKSGVPRGRLAAFLDEVRELSMGTSQDYRVAAEEGATLVRVGSVLLGR